MRVAPAPGGLDDDVDVLELRLPAELALDPLARGEEHRRIAVAARSQLIRHAFPGHALDGGHHVTDRGRTAVAEVVGIRSRASAQGVEREHVRRRQIVHVDVVAEARAVRRRVVVAEHVKGAAPHGRIDRARNHVELRIVILAELPFRVGARGVEVPERDRAKAVRALVVWQRVLDGELGLAIGVDRALGQVLVDGRRFRKAENRAGRGKDEVTNAGGHNGIEHRQRPDDVVAVVARRVLHRIAHRKPGREVHHRVDLVRLDRRLQPGGVVDVALDDGRCPRRGRTMPLGEIVVDDDRLTARPEHLDGMAADVAGATGDEHCGSRTPHRMVRESPATAGSPGCRCCGRRRSPGVRISFRMRA